MVGNADKSMLAAIRAMVGQLNDEKTRAALESVLRGEQPAAAAAPIRQEVLTGDEVAAMLHIGRRMVSNLAKSGAIRRVKAPKRKRAFGFSRASVEQFIAGREAGQGEGVV